MIYASGAPIAQVMRASWRRTTFLTTLDLLRRVSRKGSVNSAVSHFHSLNIGCKVMLYMLADQAHVAHADALSSCGMIALLLLSNQVCLQDEAAQQPVKR